MITGPVIAAFFTLILMAAAFHWHQWRAFHMPIMGGIILFDLAIPFYLFSTRDWYQRLLVDGDILSFGMWMHFGLIITLFVLYAIQIQSALQLKKGTADTEARKAHGAQGKAILLARTLVIATGTMLAESPAHS
jgi:hypothetical protein